jgi:hypothetical protein
MVFHINGACWHHYPPEALLDLMEAHPLLFPAFRRADWKPPTFSGGTKAGAPYTDPWGCVWETSDDGIAGAVIRHPLADWAAFEGYTPPDPERFSQTDAVSWEDSRQSRAKARAEGQLVWGGLGHGHTFMRLMYLRGYENLLVDMAQKDPRLDRLIGMVEAFNLAVVRHELACGLDVVGYPEDLGMQVGPMIPPAHFRRYIRPVYERLMTPAREAGCVIHMHSDGDIRTLLDDLLLSGVEVMNLQDLVNGLDWIRSRLAGRVCIDLDVDRQRVTRFGTPAQIDALIREEVEKLGSREGGLTMIHGLYPGVPLANVRALMDAMERYARYYA